MTEIKKDTSIFFTYYKIMSLTSKTSIEKEHVNESFLKHMIKSYSRSFQNIDIHDPIIEKGADGNCLFYSILQAETKKFHDNIGVKSFEYDVSSPHVPQKSQHFKNGMTLRKYIGRRLRHAYDYNNGLKNTISKPGSRINRKKMYEQLKPIVDVYGSANNDFAFNGDGDVEETPYDDYMQPHFFAGDMTLTAYTLLFKKHLIIFNMSSPYTLGTVTFRKVEGVDFDNNFDEPNYIFLVRSGGVNTHFRTLRSIFPGEQVMLHDDVIDELNKNKTDQLSYKEFKKILSVAAPPRSLTSSKSKTKKNIKSTSKSKTSKTKKNIHDDKEFDDDLHDDMKKINEKIMKHIVMDKLNGKVKSEEELTFMMVTVESFLTQKEKEIKDFVKSIDV